MKLYMPGATAFASGKRVALGAYAATITGVLAEFDGNDPVARGRYLAAAADCKACHTVPGDLAFAGGRPFTTSFGTLYSPKITPDRATSPSRIARPAGTVAPTSPRGWPIAVTATSRATCCRP